MNRTGTAWPWGLPTVTELEARIRQLEDRIRQLEAESAALREMLAGGRKPEAEYGA